MGNAVEEPIHNEAETCRFMADAYVSKIMIATYEKALSIQKISKICQIPIAVAYRRVERMLDLGLLVCVGEEESYRGKKKRYFLCANEIMRYSFVKGTFTCQICPKTIPTNQPSNGFGSGCSNS
jgi:hypothetical protein